jgi:hypothetical protein
MVKVLPVFLLTGMLWPGPTPQAQTIISESGRLLFFNSLDSARAATIIRLTGFVNCWLNNFDSRDSFPILLDFRPDPDTLHPDSASLQLGYDNLFGNSLFYTDSSAAPSDPGQQLYYQKLGLRIRLGNPSPDPKTLLQLLEYGIAHYVALRQIRNLCLSDGPASRSGYNPDHDAGQVPGPVTLVPGDIVRILARPLSTKLRLALKSCH